MAARPSEFGVRIGITLAHAAAYVLSRFGLGALRVLGAAVGSLASLGKTRAARATRVNIELVYGDRDPTWRRLLARQSLVQTAMTLFEAAALWTWPRQRLAKLTKSVEGEELLRGRAPGRGAIVVITHFGNWEYLGFYLNTVEPLTPLYQRPGSPAVDEALTAARGRLGSDSVAASVPGLRHLVRTLSNGGLVAILPDQVPSPDSGVVAPFFGRPALTMSLLSKLLQRTRADVVIGTARRVRGGFAIRIEALDDAVHDPDPVVSAGAINAAVEVVAGRDPAQYQWEYKRYRLPGGPDIYKR